MSYLFLRDNKVKVMRSKIKLFWCVQYQHKTSYILEYESLFVLLEYLDRVYYLSNILFEEINPYIKSFQDEEVYLSMSSYIETKSVD